MPKGDLQKRYGDIASFLKVFNPDNQKLIVHDTRKCITGNYPTLGELSTEYSNKNAPIAWLIPQLVNLSEYCGVKDKMEGQPLKEVAYVIATDFHYLKVTELMLFFHMFKAGKLGKFYGCVDPLVITAALRDFITIRNNELVAQDREDRQKAREIHDQKYPPITYEEYQSSINNNNENSVSKQTA